MAARFVLASFAVGLEENYVSRRLAAAFRTTHSALLRTQKMIEAVERLNMWHDIEVCKLQPVLNGGLVDFIIGVVRVAPGGRRMARQTANVAEPPKQGAVPCPLTQDPFMFI